MPTTLGSINDGARFTVAEYRDQPTVVPAMVLALLTQEFIAEYLLRKITGNGGSVTKFYESTPLYAPDLPENVAEFGMIPVTLGSRGTPKVAIAQRKGLGVQFSQEMVDENDVDAVNVQMTQCSNSMVQTWDVALRSLITSGSVPTINATAHWGGTGSAVRVDIADAIQTVISAKPAVSQGNDRFGFKPDTIVMNDGMWALLGGDPSFDAILKSSPLADQQILYTGQMPANVLGLSVVTSPTWPTTEVLVCQRNRLGGYNDARPLHATPVYEVGGASGMGGPSETWRSDVTRKTGLFLDQPSAAVRILAVG